MSQHIHIIGIGGAGMSPLALILLQQGHRVSGSDLKASPVTDRLAEQGATIYIGHRAEQVKGADLVAVTAAARPDNIEVQAARAAGIPVLKGSQLLGRLMAGQIGIAIAGTHGKTTTTTLVTQLLTAAHLDPSYVIGGEPMDLPASGHWGQGRHFVAEADEYDRRFLDLSPTIALITNIEPDHLDCYGTFAVLVEAFRSFAHRVSNDGYLIVCGDDPWARRVGEAWRQPERVLFYGTGPNLTWQAIDITPNDRGGHDFTATRHGDAVGRFQLQIPGRHNVVNALGALAVATLVGVGLETAQVTLSQFRGSHRRFEVKGEVGGIIVVDDYAHHPSEIRATLAAARVRYPGRRIIAVHQPHTYSRTRALLTEFAAALSEADRVIVTEVYAARESDTLGVSGADVVRAMHHPAAGFAATLAEAAQQVLAEVRPGDVVITLGAGDVLQVGEIVLSGLKSGTKVQAGKNYGQVG